MNKFLKTFLIILTVIGVSFLIWKKLQLEKPKTANDKVKSALSSFRVQAQIIYDEKRSYETLFSDPVIADLLINAEKNAEEVKYFNNSNTFVIVAAFKKPINQTHWCVDSSGFNGYIDQTRYSLIINSDTLCR